MSPSTINNVVFHLRQPLLAEAALALTPRSAGEPNYILEQTDQPLTGEQRAQLVATEAEILEYVPDATYVCFFTPAGLDMARALPFISWPGPYLRDVKVELTLTALPSPGREERLAVMNTAAPYNLLPEPQAVDVVFHGNADANAVVQRISEIAQVEILPNAVSPEKVRLTASPEAITAMAGLDAVRHIEKVLPPELFNERARLVLRVPGRMPAPPVEGEDQVVADTGFDNGLTDHTVHPAFQGRVARLQALGRVNPANPDDDHGQGTHVAGSVLCNATSAAPGLRVQGTGPAARLVLQSRYRSAAAALGGLPANLRNLVWSPYAEAGAPCFLLQWYASAALTFPLQATTFSNSSRFEAVPSKQAACTVASQDRGTPDKPDIKS